MRSLAILSILAGIGSMARPMPQLENTWNLKQIHARHTPKDPTATRDRKNTGSGVAKAKRASRKAKNKARH